MTTQGVGKRGREGKRQLLHHKTPEASKRARDSLRGRKGQPTRRIGEGRGGQQGASWPRSTRQHPQEYLWVAKGGGGGRAKKSRRGGACALACPSGAIRGRRVRGVREPKYVVWEKGKGGECGCVRCLFAPWSWVGSYSPAPPPPPRCTTEPPVLLLAPCHTIATHNQKMGWGNGTALPQPNGPGVGPPWGAKCVCSVAPVREEKTTRASSYAQCGDMLIPCCFLSILGGMECCVLRGLFEELRRESTCRGGGAWLSGVGSDLFHEKRQGKRVRRLNF